MSSQNRTFNAVAEILAAALLLCAVGTQSASAAEQWKDLFNGKDLTGWVQRGGKASYSVSDGSIVGRSVLGTENSFLCTRDEFSDFILELEFKVSPELNSGVQVRSECFGTEKTVVSEGKQIKIPADRVHGYQVEIDMEPKNDRWWTAGIYDEGRRGWLYPGTLGGDKAKFTAKGAKISKQGEWNKLRIEARGDTIRTWLNGESRAEIKDSMTPRGFIALQVHGVGNDKSKEGLAIEFRNIRLENLGRH